MQATNETIKANALKNKTPFLVRSFKYVWGRKIRFIFLGTLIYFGYSRAWLSSIRGYFDGIYANYQKRWLNFYNPTAVRYTTPNDFSLKAVATDLDVDESIVQNVAELMFKVDN